MSKMKYIVTSLMVAVMTVVAGSCQDVPTETKSSNYVVDITAEMAMPEVIPTPQNITVGEGVLSILSNAEITFSEPSLCAAAEYLASYLTLEFREGSGGVIHLTYDAVLPREAYGLMVDESGIRISGGEYGGVINGITTLLQLLPSEVYEGALSFPVQLPLCDIKDAPRYAYRGFMLDVCRTWMSKEMIMEYVDLLAHHKINTLRLHLTDDEAWRIEIESHPELAQEGGFRGGDAKIWPRYGKWSERWGGYYTKADMREIIDYAAVRNIEVIPEIDLPGHSLCIATLHPEILCDYQPNTSRAFGYDTRSAFCASKESNYALLEDILREVCELFPSSYIHIGGDEVDMSQWKRCPDCQRLMQEKGMETPQELQQYFMSRLSDILTRYGKLPAVWNEAIEGGTLSSETRVYGWEGIKECRAAAAEGYATVVMPGQYFYFDMKQTPREPGHDWAAVFDWSKVYSFSPKGVGFSATEEQNILGLEASFFSELYASHTPETLDYLHYMTFPRMVAFSEVAWVNSDERDAERFYKSMVSHYNRLDAMGVAYRLMPPVVKYENGLLSVSTDDGSKVYYTFEYEGNIIEREYTKPKDPHYSPQRYAFVSRRGKATSPKSADPLHFETMTPPFNITSSMTDSERFSFDKAEGYGRLARTTRAADVGDWIMFDFAVVDPETYDEFGYDEPDPNYGIKCRRMEVATGNFQLPRYIFEKGYVEVTYSDGETEILGELECGKYTIDYPKKPIRSVRIVCTSRGNGAEWVSIQPPTIYPLL